MVVPTSAIDNAPPLDVWERLRVARELLGGTVYDRQAKCHWTRLGDNASIRRFESGGYALAGFVQCGVYACANCGSRRCRDTASKLAVCMQRHLHGDGAGPERDVWMISLTAPHRLTDDLGEHMRRLHDARRRFWRTPAWRRFRQRWGISSKVDVFDATHGGGNGCHPHFHCALFVDRAWIEGWRVELQRTDDVVVRDAMGHVVKPPRPPTERELSRSGDAEGKLRRFAERDQAYAGALAIARERHLAELRAAVDAAPLVMPYRGLAADERLAFLRQLQGGLVPAWEKSCLDAGLRIDNYTAFREHALDLQPSEKASSYFTKWGLADEVGASTAKSRSHLRLLDAIAAGCDLAGDAYLAFREAVDGHAWVVGLADTCARFGVTDDDAHDYLRELREKQRADAERRGEPVAPPKRELHLKLRPAYYAGVLALGWNAVFAEIDRLADELQLDGEALQNGLDRFLMLARLTRGRGPPRAGPSPAPLP